MNLDSDARATLQNELLCLADSKWVLGHWYIKLIRNGRAITDFTSYAALAQDALGHARALFRFAEDFFDLPEFQLEFGRSADQIHSMELLDAPPQNWGDMLISTWLAETALWRFGETLEGDFAPLAGMLNRFHEETYFHRLFVEGQLKDASAEESQQIESCVTGRVERAVRWFGRDEADPLVASGIRAHAVGAARERFLKDAAGTLGVGPGDPSDSGEWDADRRRVKGTALPPTLWEFMVPTNEAAKLARRPLAISVDDNIDLFPQKRAD